MVKTQIERASYSQLNIPFWTILLFKTLFGIKGARAVYQKWISKLLEDLQGVETDIHYILIWGRMKEEHAGCLKWLKTS